MTLDQLRAMDIHTEAEYDAYTKIIRVPNGWIYVIMDGLPLVPSNMVFVQDKVERR